VKEASLEGGFRAQNRERVFREMGSGPTPRHFSQFDAVKFLWGLTPFSRATY
jgi:hypothetical protein